MRKTLLLSMFVLGAGLAQAQVVSPLGGSTNNPQTPPPATQAPPVTSTPPASTSVTPGASGAEAATGRSGRSTSTGSRTRMTQAQRFEAANTTHDGKLTRDQARAGHMRAVTRDFDKIDVAKHGYVTMDDIKAYGAKRRAERRAERAQKTHASQ